MTKTFVERILEERKKEFYSESYYKPEGWNEALRLLKSLGFSTTGDNDIEKLLRLNNRIRRRYSCYGNSKKAKIYFFSIKIIETELRRLSKEASKNLLASPK
ncbi:MAG: hypothetical protein ACRCTZ_19010 [Sarcina sp.]